MKHRTLTHLYPVEHRTFMAEVMPGIERFVHRWQPLTAPPRATLTIVHGLGDHVGRFASFANSLASTGLGIIGIDLMGHGHSPGRRGVIPSYEALLDEVGNAVYYTSREWPQTPTFVLGQSMGGNLVLNWSMRRPFEAKSQHGIIAMAPMLRMARCPSSQFLRIGRWLGKLLPNLRLTAPVDVRQLCSDPLGQDHYLQDRVVHTKISMRLGMALIDSGEWVLDNASQLAKPTLLMHGADDTLTCPLATEQLAKKTSKVVTLRIWPNCRHDLHHEIQRESVAAFLLDWIRAQSRSSNLNTQTSMRHAA